MLYNSRLPSLRDKQRAIEAERVKKLKEESLALEEMEEKTKVVEVRKKKTKN